MFSIWMVIGVAMVFSGLGFVAGALVTRNNYKRLVDLEKQFKDLVLDNNVSNDALVLRIRNKLKI